MEAILLRVLNMSVSAGWLILAVIVLRLLLRKAPKWIPVLFWAMVGLRLGLPFTVRAGFSLVPDPALFRPSVVSAAIPAISGGLPGAGGAADPGPGASPSEAAPAVAASAQTWTAVLFAVWIAGAAAVLIFGAVGFLRLRRRIAEAVPVRNGIWTCDRISSPFVLGVFRPRVYLPSGLGEAETAYVLAHEAAHLKRRDHLWKPLGFLLLSVHWFNPLVWVAYVLLCRDMEMACDEKVIAGLEMPEKKAYANALVSCSMQRRMVFACPLAFGEVGVRERVKGVLNYRKPAFWLTLAAVLLCLAVAACFLTDPRDDEPDLSFLNYRNAVSLVGQNGAARVIYCPPGTSEIQIGSADGRELADYLETRAWTKKILSPGSLPSPGSVQFVIEEGYRITVYQKPRVASVRFEDQVRYYRIGPGDYESAVALIHPEAASSSVFRGRILEILPDAGGAPSYLVEVSEDGALFHAGDQVTVPLRNSAPSPEPVIGDVLEVSFAGDVLETWPMQLTEVLSVRVIRGSAPQDGPAYDRIPCVMVDGNLFLDTGRDASRMIPPTPRSSFDGAITSEVDPSELPSQDGQSNFGAGYGYMVIDEDNIAVYMDQNWWLFTKEGASSASEAWNRAFWLTIGAEGVKSIEVTTPYSSGGCENADGSLYAKGDRVRLEPLDGLRDLRGVTVSARDEAGTVIWTASIPYEDSNAGFTRLTQDGWTITDLTD